jgi:hypothetical protein
MLIEIVKYTPERKSDWDAFVSGSRTPIFMFLRDYLDYHSDRFVDTSVLIYKNGNLAGIFPCNSAQEAIISHGGLTYGGLITSLELHSPDIIEIFESICSYFRDLGFARILYKAVPSAFSTYPSEEILYGLSRVGATLYRRDLSSVIELANRPRLSDSRKSTARKAAKAGAYVVLSDDFAGFHKLLAAILSKFGVQPVHSLPELLLLKSRFQTRILLFTTMLGEEMAAAALVYDFGHVVHTQYLAASDQGRKIGALDYLLMTLVEETFSSRRYFSFGISTEKNGAILNEGLIRQKEGFGARGLVHDFYEIKL